MGAPTKNMTVFLNISKVFLGSTDTAAGNSRGTDIVGFSIAPRKKR
jgi:Ca2+/Na+ antiporter